jgi:hypothetical protein
VRIRLDPGVHKVEPLSMPLTVRLDVGSVSPFRVRFLGEYCIKDASGELRSRVTRDTYHYI